MGSCEFCSLLIFGLCFVFCRTKPANQWPAALDDYSERQNKVYKVDKEIEEIANKEYDTVHGRILAVNMAHIRKKREMAEMGGQDDNVFHRINEANSGNLSELYQGDMDLDPELKEYIRSGGLSRNAIRARKRLWSTRIIPYRIPSWMSHITSNVLKAINDFHSKTCIRFVQYRGYHRDYIEFSNTYGCSSKVGRHYAQPGKQAISIGDGCNNVGTIIHELMHTVGFFHEQSRSDRDKYVKIYWENILDGQSDQFDKYSWRTIDELGVSYDYQSIMHYDRLAFTKNGLPTILAIGNENMEFKSPDFKLSTRDAVEINALYDCHKTQSYGWSSWSGWTPCDDNCFRTRERYCYNSGNLQSCGGNVNVYGVEAEKQKCPSSICPVPVDGHWGRWSDWRPCSKTCNDGVRTRFRKCNNPLPGQGGKYCVGSSTGEEPCILKRCHLDKDDVDFENFRLGMWKNSNIDKLNWGFNSGYTQTAETGPSTDHTNGRGYYLYVESSGTTSGQTADLVSPWIAAKSGGECLKLYYTMYGKTMGSLAIKMDLSNGKSWFIFYKNGNQGIHWKKGTGNIDVPLGVSYRLTIQGKIGQPGYSDIAIDDVYIDSGLCSCQDEFHTCHIWAAKGECNANEVWMKQNCKRSCNVCRVNVAVDGQWGKWSNWGSCSKTCNYGVRTRSRACNSPAPAHGGKHCQGSANQQESCNLKKCPVGCVDNTAYKDQCPLWAQNGECKTNPSWMKENCRKSCQSCSPACTDSNISCPAWAKLGECVKNPSWMKSNCRLSCINC